MMKPRIAIKKIWFDDDTIELAITVCNGISLFETNVYVGYSYLKNLIKDLNVFRKQIHGGIYDIDMNNFGPEYANGAFQARLHFYMAGKLSISTFQQSAFADFANRQEASEAKMYLKTEPVLLDNFIVQLMQVESGALESAELECT